MFVTFEGIEGSGKSTLIRTVAAELRKRGVDPVETREPGGTVLGDELRRIFLNPAERIDPVAEVLLLNASRAQLVAEVITPALRSARIVLCDRFFDATVAYQGFGRGLEVESLLTLSLFATQRVAPEMTFLLDLPVDVARERVVARQAATGTADDRVEREPPAFHQRVRDGYLELARRFGRIVVIDATLPADAIAARVLERIERARTHA